jgi:hypothetical protein
MEDAFYTRKTSTLPHTPQEMPLFSTMNNEIDLRIKSLGSNASYVQMKSLDGFSCLQLGRYCLNPETEPSSQGP